MYPPNVTLFRQFFMIRVKVHGDSMGPMFWG